MDMNEKLDLILSKVSDLDSKVSNLDNKVDEHSRILNALVHGQEELKANLDGFKIEVYKRFDDMNQRQDKLEAKQDSFQARHEDLTAKTELLADRTWTNESDIHRLKKIAGIN